MVTAIFPAAGSSHRMGKGANKIFMNLLGESILLRTLKTFSKVDRIGFLIVVVSEFEIKHVEELLQTSEVLKPWKLVIGGAERQYSVANGLKFLPEDADIVLVHDAARPLVSVDLINSVIDTTIKFGGAISAVSVKNTIKSVGRDGFVNKTLQRNELVEIQTPQGFRKKKLLEAYQKAQTENFIGTDDSSLVERLGLKIKIVNGDYQNIKITTPEDIQIAECFLRTRIHKV